MPKHAALKMPTETFAKRRHYAIRRRGIHPEALTVCSEEQIRCERSLHGPRVSFSDVAKISEHSSASTSSRKPDIDFGKSFNLIVINNRENLETKRKVFSKKLTQLIIDIFTFFKV